MKSKVMIFLIVCGLIFITQTLTFSQEQSRPQGTISDSARSNDKGKKKLLNDWLSKITKKIETKKIDFESDKPKEVTAIIGLRGWELQVTRFDVPNWLGEIVTSKDKFLLGLEYAKEEKINSAIIIFESFIKNFPESKAKTEAEKAIEVLSSLQ